jgi:predicted DsbA family dithiol-disulfide isomerase
VWLSRVKKVYKDDLEITWKNFSLEQVNSKNGPDWKVWEHAEDHDARSLWAARAGEAARRQGEDAYNKFHLALLTARFGREVKKGEERFPLNQPEPLVKLAGEVGLDVGQFQEDLKDPELLSIIGRDHTEAVEKYGIFGTPTFLFSDGNAAYLKAFIPSEEDTVAAFEHFLGVTLRRPFIGEIKRPQPPWPKGALR